MLQRFIAALEFALAATELGDVGERRHEATAGHRVAANLDDAAIREHALGEMRRARAHERQTPIHRALTTATLRHCLQRPAGQVHDRPADLQQLVGETKHPRIRTIPCHQTLIAVDHTDALAHVLQCRLQHLLTEAQILRCLADDGRDRRQFTTFAPRGVQQQARRCRTEHGREFTFQLRFNQRRHRPVARRIGKQPLHFFCRQKTTPGIAQGVGIQIAAGAIRCIATPCHRQQRHRRAHEQTGAHRTPQRCPSGQSKQALRRQPLPTERTFG
ncbi:hypothetical protein D3C71_1038660 [compost metagenome]